MYSQAVLEANLGYVCMCVCAMHNDTTWKMLVNLGQSERAFFILFLVL